MSLIEERLITVLGSACVDGVDSGLDLFGEPVAQLGTDNNIHPVLTEDTSEPEQSKKRKYKHQEGVKVLLAIYDLKNDDLFYH